MITPESSAQMTRKQYQKKLRQHRQRIRKRRKSRIRRVRFVRSLRTTRFWTRVAITTAVLLMLAFWSRFAYVYNIPSYAEQGSLVGVEAYVTVKSWWFGPPIFNLNEEAQYPLSPVVVGNSYGVLIQNLGKYSSVIENPRFIWVRRN